MLHEQKQAVFCVAGVRLRLSLGKDAMEEKMWSLFAEAPGREPDVTFLAAGKASTDYQVERYALPAACRQVFRYGQDVVLADEGCRTCVLLPVTDPCSPMVLLNHVFYTHAVRRQMLQLHCATIDDGGRGVLFLGPSGIGKTTQAERWAQFLPLSTGTWASSSGRGRATRPGARPGMGLRPTASTPRCR